MVSFDVSKLNVAVCIPCYNEEITVGKVVDDFKKSISSASIYVFDNNSKDKTAQIAKEHEAVVISSTKQGKGNVIRHMFSGIDADLLVMADGDDTYPASEVNRLIEIAYVEHIDMLVGARLKRHSEGAFRFMHVFGNKLVANIISTLFAVKLSDVLSGYRVFLKSYYKSVPLLSKGFDIETEMTLQALAKGFKIKEVPVEYGTRPEGSFSKLNTYSDGYIVLKAIFNIFKDYRPLIFYSLCGSIFAILSLIAGAFPIYDFIKESYVHHVPLAILACGLGIIAVLCFGIGIVLETIYKYQRENYEFWKRMFLDKGNFK